MASKTPGINRYHLQTAIDGLSVVHTSYAPDTTGEPLRVAIQTRWKRDVLLDRGSLGEIWCESCEATGELRAVRVFSRGLLTGWKIDYERAVQTLVALRAHPESFIQFLNWFDDRNAIYLAMEYTTGGHLDQYIADDWRHARTQAIDITKQILEGLAVLHARSLYHGDLKPQNIVVTSATPLCVKLTDFSLSIGRTGMDFKRGFGVQSYRAPEQLGLLPDTCKTKTTATSAVDLWALGIVVFEILTSKSPFGDVASFTGIAIGSNMTPTVNASHLLLSNYCHGTEQFPTALLHKHLASAEATYFIQTLLVVDPRGRVSAASAIRSPWLVGISYAPLVEQFGELGVELTTATANRLVTLESHSHIMELLHVVTMTDIWGILHGAAANGYLEVLRILLPLVYDIDHQPKGFSMLQLAARGGHVPVLKLLLDNGAHVNYPPSNSTYPGRTALFAAVEGRHLTAMKLLLTAGATVDTVGYVGPDRRPPLKAAAELGFLEGVKLLLRSGAKVNGPRRSEISQAALPGASGGGFIDIMKLLLRQGAKVNDTRGGSGWAALQAAAAGGHLDAVKLLLDSNGRVDGKRCQLDCLPALEAAVEGGYFDVVKLLLRDGAKVNAEVGKGNHRTDGGTPLHAAARRGDLDIMELLLANGAIVNPNKNPRGYDQWTPLQAATEGGHLDAVKLLLRRGANINAPADSSIGRTAIQAAAAGGDLDLINLLMDNGADINAKPNGRRGRTALQAAAAGGHLAAIQLLLNNGAEVNASDDGIVSGRTALQAAAEGGHHDAVKLLLESGARPNAPAAKFEGQTALRAAAAVGSVELVNLLLASGADVNLPNSHDGRNYKPMGTALQCAADRGHLEIMKLLLDSGAKVNTVPDNTPPRRALAAAAYRGHVEAMKLLLDAGSKVDHSDWQTAMSAAASNGQLEATKLLLDRGANPQHQPFRRQPCPTALEGAAGNGHVDIMKLLLDRGADIHPLPDSKTPTALQGAAASGSLDGIRLLLERRACQRSADGVKSLIIAARGGYVDIVKLLLDLGVDPNAPSDMGPKQSQTVALFEAAESGRLEVVKLLLDRGADVNSQEPDCRPALEGAALHGYLAVSKLLLDSGANISVPVPRNGKTVTLVSLVVKAGYYDVAQILKDRGAAS